MEELIMLLVVGAVTLLAGAIMGIVAACRTTTMQRDIEQLRSAVRQLQEHQQESRPAATPVAAPAASSAPATTPTTAPPPAPTTAPIASPTAAQVAARLAASTTPPPAEPPWPAPATVQPSEPVAKADDPVAAPPPLPVPSAWSEHASASEARPKAPANEQFGSVEKALGMRWLTWIGVGLLFLGVAFFLKYAYDRDWLGRYFGPRLRIATAAMIAAVLAATGWRSLKNGLVALGQGLLGGAQALLYLTVFAAFQPAALVVDTPLIGASTAFVLMIAITALGLAAAVRLDAIAMAFLAVLGGLATPALIQTGQDGRDALCGYLLLLDLGVLGVAAWRQWRALDVLAFAGTALLFGGWWAAWRHVHPQPDATLVWLSVFHVVFLVLPFAQHWRRGTPATAERFVLALANVAWSLAYAANLLHDTAPRLLAGACLAAAALYVTLGWWTSRRVGGDLRTRDGFFALAALQATIGLFFLLPTNAITTAWFGEAVLLVWIGHRFAHATSRRLALLTLAAAMARTVIVHLPTITSTPPLLWNEWCITLLIAGVGLGAFAAMHMRLATATGERQLAQGLGMLAALWSLGVVSGEIARHAHGHSEAWWPNGPSLAIAWLQCAGAALLLGWAQWRRSRTAFATALLPLLAAAIAVGVAYDHYPADALAVVNGACLAGLTIVALLGLAAHQTRRHYGIDGPRETMLGAAQLALTALATIETAAFLQRGAAEPSRTTIAQALVWVWLALAAGGSVAAMTWSSRRMLALTALPLALAAGGGLWLYGRPLDPHRLIANQRLVSTLLTCAVFAALRRPLLRLATSTAADLAGAAGLLGVLVFGCCEAISWCNHTGADLGVQLWLLGATFVLGTAGAAWRAEATGNRSLRSVGLIALAPALLLPLSAYATAADAPLMFLNGRAVMVAAAVAAAWLWSRSSGLDAMRRVALIAALLGLTFEPPSWFLDHIEDLAEARRLARFSITVTWLVSATALLLIGFRRDLRMARLTALTLFVLTAAKVLTIDMSGAQQLYRILAFLLVGVVFVGASWAYHRAERRLAAARAANDGDATAAAPRDTP